MENKKNYSYLIPIVMALFMAVGLFVGNSLAPKQQGMSAMSQGQSDYQKMQDIIQILDNKYVDEVNADDLFEKTIGDMLHNLDPHSNYIPASELRAMNEQIEGRFGGVGVRFFIIRDTLCITNVLPHSPSERAGLKSGDKIIKIDGELVASKKITNDKVMGMLKGIEGTDVKLEIWREGEIMKKQVTRGGIPIESVVASYMINETIGYVRVSTFSKTTADEFRWAAADLRRQGMKKMILDVRSNRGGILTGATEIADEFLMDGLTIVDTKGDNISPYRYSSSSQGKMKNMEVAILINSNSASASEILAGAIQDNDRGTIIGRRSFGKGLVQEDVLLRDSSNLRLTIARYYTPTGRCIQKPYTGDIADYYQDQADRYENGEMYEVDSSLFVDSLKFITPKGKTVYGGGGIMPDVFVPFDTSGSSWYFSQLRYSSVFTTFAFDFVQGKRSKWSSPEQYAKEFTVSDALLDRLVAFAKSEYDIPKSEAGFKNSKELIRRILKGEIARQIWVEEGYFQVINKDDPEVQEAINTLH